MRQRLICITLAFLTLAMMPMMALAQQAQAKDSSKVYDGRLEGYGRELTLDAGGSALIWLLLVLLAAICLGVLFKHAKRTHLD